MLAPPIFGSLNAMFADIVDEHEPAGTVPADVLWNLGLYQAPIPAIFVFIAVILYSGYRLDRTRHAEILAELARRRAAAAPGDGKTTRSRVA